MFEVFGILAKEFVDDRFQKQEVSKFVFRSLANPIEPSEWECHVPTKLDFGDFCLRITAIAGIPVAFYAQSIRQSFDIWGWIWASILLVGSIVVYLARPKTIPYGFYTKSDSFEIREWNKISTVEHSKVEFFELTVKQFFETNIAKISLKVEIEDSPSITAEFSDVPTEVKNELIKHMKKIFSSLDEKL